MDYNIAINNMERYVTSGSLSDVVSKVSYDIVCTGSNNGTSSINSTRHNITLSSVGSSSFVAYGSLTQPIVEAWITGSITWGADLQLAESALSESIWLNTVKDLPVWEES